MVNEALEVIREAQGKRVLILCSYRNRYRFEEAIRAEATDRVVDMGAWLRASFQPSADARR